MYRFITRPIIMSGIFLVLSWGNAAINNSYSQSVKKELSDEIYVYLTDKILSQNVGPVLGGVATSGRVNPYRNLQPSKALAGCLVFKSERLSGVVVKGWWAAVGRGDSFQARHDTMESCKFTREKKKGCKCFIIDVDDSSYISRSGILNIITEGN